MFFRIERSGPPDGGPDRVNPSRFPTRPAKPRSKSFYSGLKPENFLSLQPLRVHGSRPSFVWIAHPRRPSGRRLPSPCARTSLPSGCAASTQPGAFVPCVCLCLSPIASHQVERGMLSGRYLYRPGGPPPTPTHALGSRPSHDRFAVSASRSASRNPSTPDFSDVLHEHPPLHLLDSALCSPARSLPAKPT